MQASLNPFRTTRSLVYVCWQVKLTGYIAVESLLEEKQCVDYNCLPMCVIVTYFSIKISIINAQGSTENSHVPFASY